VLLELKAKPCHRWRPRASGTNGASQRDLRALGRCEALQPRSSRRSAAQPSPARAQLRPSAQAGAIAPRGPRRFLWCRRRRRRNGLSRDSDAILSQSWKPSSKPEARAGAPPHFRYAGKKSLPTNRGVPTLWCKTNPLTVFFPVSPLNPACRECDTPSAWHPVLTARCRMGGSTASANLRTLAVLAPRIPRS